MQNTPVEVMQAIIDNDGKPVKGWVWLWDDAIWYPVTITGVDVSMAYPFREKIGAVYDICRITEPAAMDELP